VSRSVVSTQESLRTSFRNWYSLAGPLEFLTVSCTDSFHEDRSGRFFALLARLIQWSYGIAKATP